MEIKDLKPRQGSIEVVGEVIEKGEVREFEKFGKKGRVCNAKIKDATGEIALTLWNEQIDQVNVGDTVHIINGYVNEWQGEPQLTSGKFGTIEVGDKGKKEEVKPEEMKSDVGSHILTEDEAKEEEILEEEGKKEPSLEASETKEEETESEILEEKDLKKAPSLEKSESEDEKTEEIGVEEEEVE
jgi:replication factor A1